MLNRDDHLYFSSIPFNNYQNSFWNSFKDDLNEAGKFILDLGERINPNRFVSRNGVWTTPWPQKIIPGFEMPEYDPNFSKSFSEVTDERALGIKQLINEKNQRFAVMYSGGLDSTLIMAALIKHLTQEELKNITVCTSAHAIAENPYFWSNYIFEKFYILDSTRYKYDSLIEAGYRPITADEGDCIFGTAFGLAMYANYDALVSDLSVESRQHLMCIKENITDGDTHFSQYKDIIIRYLALPGNLKFGEEFYNKFVKNIETASVPIQSLHDFFWWMIFNIKYLNCSVRGAIYYNDRVPVKSAIYDHIINWFNFKDYQRWSMANNNNGEKILFSQSTYKMATRKYIYDLDKNPWYFHFKIKLESLAPSIVLAQDNSNVPLKQQANARFGLDKDFNTLYIDDPAVQDYIKHHLFSYQKDW